MRVYSVEVFDKNFTYCDHTNVTGISYSEDYLAPEANSITVENINANRGDYIRITGGPKEFFGIITGLTSESKELTTISFKPFLSLFDLDILFNTNYQGGSVSLETFLKDTIMNTFHFTTDDEMRIEGLDVVIEGTTENWTLNLKSDDEELHYCITNLLRTIIIRVFEKYSIVVKAVPNIPDKRITVYIGKNASSVRTIEADLPNIIEKNVIIRTNTNSVNKVVVYNSENYTDRVTFYLHPDDTFDIVDENRLFPVVQEMYATAPTYDEYGVVTTFEEAAYLEAEDAFANSEYNNLIEIRMDVDDELYFPTSYEIGQVVNVISDDKQYTSIFTGFELTNTVKLIFGIIRVDLTKQIWRSSYGY